MQPPRSNRPPIGWPLLPLPDEAGQLHWPSLQRCIADSLRILLSTQPGERLQRPRFGVGLQSFLHQPNTSTTRRRIRDVVQDGLSRWERRIELLEVEVVAVEDAPTDIRVEIRYRILRTGSVQQLGLTLSLEGA